MSAPRSSPRSAMQLLAALIICCCGWLAPTSEAFVVRRSASYAPDNCESLRKFIANDAEGGAASVPSTINGHLLKSDGRDAAYGQSATICGGHCCNNETEEHLRQQAKEDFHTQIHHHSRSLLGLLATTADSLRNTVALLARQSENKTLTLFNQVYRGMSAQSKPSVLGLYQAMIDYVSVSNTAESLQQPLSQDSLQDRFTEFFTHLFPVAYHQAVSPSHQSQPTLQQDFTEKFKSCLHKMMYEIEPFDGIPKQIGLAMGKSLEATRVLIQALTLGKSVLEKSDRLMFSGNGPQQEACYKALLRMTHCPKCRGVPHDVMPCRGFCTNVMRGCLTEAASELDFAWSEYVETVERLVMALDGHNDDPLALNVENAFRQLDSRISDAVMLAMEKGPVLEEKVRKVCGRAEVDSPGGPAQLVLPSSLSPSSSSFSGTRGPGPGLSLAALQQLPPVTTPSPSRAPGQLHAQLGNFLASVASSRSFYGNLADAMCDEYPERACWNGERVAEYAKTVVDSSFISQKYNPEFTFLASSPDTENKGYLNANTNVINDQLRRINQLVQSQLMSAPDMASVLLADEAFEGSGSGDRPLWGRRPGPEAPDDTDDNDDDNSADDERDDDGASGSGMGPSDNDHIQPDNGGDAETKDAGGASSISFSLHLLLFAPGLLLLLLEGQRFGLA